MLGATGAPPDIALVSDDSASRVVDGWFISARYTVIEATVIVGLQRWISATVWAASNRYPSTTGQRATAATAMCATMPVMWNSGATPRMTSRASSWSHTR